MNKVTTVGGNTVPPGVTYWEIEAGDTGCPFEIYKRLKRNLRPLVSTPMAVTCYGAFLTSQHSTEAAIIIGPELKLHQYIALSRGQKHVGR